MRQRFQRRNSMSLSPPGRGRRSRLSATSATTASAVGNIATPPARSRPSVRPAALSCLLPPPLVQRSPRHTSTLRDNSMSGEAATSGAETGTVRNTPVSRRKILKSRRSSSARGLESSASGGAISTGARGGTQESSNGRSTSTPDAIKKKATLIRKQHILNMTRRLHQQHSRRRMANAEILNVLSFLRHQCPSEVSLKILAYCGPNLISQLQRTQHFVYGMLDQDVSWRVLCEELYKWKPGDPQPESWKEHYRLNPCVPLDFPDIGLALAVVGSGWTPKQYKRAMKSHKFPSASAGGQLSPAAVAQAAASLPEVQTSVTVHLRPGLHSVPQSICISTLRRTTKVTLKTMELPSIAPCKTAEENVGDVAAPEAAPEECHPLVLQQRQRAHIQDNTNGSNVEAVQQQGSTRATGLPSIPQLVEDNTINVTSEKLPEPRNAILQCKSRRRNEPLIRLLRGHLVLENVQLQHQSFGVDIWNGNAALQIQPTSYSSTVSMLSPTVPLATASLRQVQVRSTSGRGVVAVDGGHLFVDDSYIHECAATGVYIGGRGSVANLIRTDVWSNGTGNPRTGGIARGHSGIYVEQGRVELHHCSVAYNTASGISLIGRDPGPPHGHPVDDQWSSALWMEHTDVLSNGCNPIEMPSLIIGGGMVHQDPPLFPFGHGSNNNNSNRHNRIAVVGVPTPHSKPLITERQEKNGRHKRHMYASHQRDVASSAIGWNEDAW